MESSQKAGSPLENMRFTPWMRTTRSEWFMLQFICDWIRDSRQLITFLWLGNGFVVLSFRGEWLQWKLCGNFPWASPYFRNQKLYAYPSPHRIRAILRQNMCGAARKIHYKFSVPNLRLPRVQPRVPPVVYPPQPTVPLRVKNQVVTRPIPPPAPRGEPDPAASSS